jgi:hypothetical protein
MSAFGVDQGSIGGKKLADFGHVAALAGLEHLLRINEIADLAHVCLRQRRAAKRITAKSAEAAEKN